MVGNTFIVIHYSIVSLQLHKKSDILALTVLEEHLMQMHVC